MVNRPNLNILKNLSKEIDYKDLDSIFHTILNEIQSYLNLDPYNEKIKIELNKTFKPDNSYFDDIFSLGVKRYRQNKFLIIEVYENYIKFLPFIFLREIYNLFVPNELKKYELVQITINQIVISDLSKHILLNKWRSLIREKIENYDLLSIGFNRLIQFDRLEGLFKSIEKESSQKPSQFFFNYLMRNISRISDRIEDIHEIFFEEFTHYISKSMNNDEIVETIKCIIDIFYKVGNYQNLLSYKNFFKDFKEKGIFDTELSLRKFLTNMDWIKNYSYIAPSYQLNWNAIDINVIVTFLRFNPILNKTQIYKIIDSLPFFISPKITNTSFALDLCGYIILPKVYLNDFCKFIEKLENFGYIIHHQNLLRTSYRHIMNLNYFREYSQNKRFVNPKNRQYEKKYEIEFQMDFVNNSYNAELSLLDFLILDRIRFFSVSGFGFERRTETLDVLKSDLLNEIITQRAQINNLKEILNLFHNSIDLKVDFLQFLDVYKKFGFFYIKEMLEKQIALLNLMEEIINNDPNIINFIQFIDLINNQHSSNVIEEEILLNKKSIRNLILNDFISVYFQSKELYNKATWNYKNFYNFFNVCYNLKLFNLNEIIKILKDKKLVETIFLKKEEKLKNYYEKYRLHEITSQDIYNTLDKFLKNKPPVIQPLLINTIIASKFVKDFFQIVLKESQESRKNLEKIKYYLPRILINSTKDIFSEENFIYVEISTPNLTRKEKLEFSSIIYNIFKDNIVIGQSYIWSGKIPILTSKNFYDFQKKEFFYTSALFEEYFLFIENTLGKKLKCVKEVKKNQIYLWSQENKIENLIANIEKHDFLKIEGYKMSNLKELGHFNLTLNQHLIDDIKYLAAKKEIFFKNHVNSIKFIPAFQYFGLSQYFLYLYPSDINEIDFKLLLINTFQKIKFPACIDNSNSFLIKYIMPYGDPNKAYLNWLVKSKKVIREYCGFFIKKVHHLFQFNFNITSEGWVYSPDRFKAHMQNILFNKDYEFQIPDIKEFKLYDTKESSHFGPNSPEYESLSNIYNWRSLNIKSYLGTLKYYPTENFTDLIKKDLIFPYLSLKNLGLQDKLYIIIPGLNIELNRTLIDIFSFFNYGFIYEIEGEYFIHGFPEEVQFKNGLMIKLYLPDCELSEFIRVFDLLFEYLEIKDYLILNDLVDGSNLLKSVFGELKFLDSYNPLKNLIWNENSKVWENHKLFTPKFEPIYPDLIENE